MSGRIMKWLGLLKHLFNEIIIMRKKTNYFSVKAGDIITFGVYPQSSNFKDKTLIKWRVLQNSDNELFVLS